MSHWVIGIYSSTTDEFLRELPLRNVDPQEIRRLWDLPQPTPIGPLEVESRHLTYLAQLLGEPLSLKPDEQAFVEEWADFVGESVEH